MVSAERKIASSESNSDSALTQTKVGAAQLFDPLQLRSITLKNRIAVSPMCQYSAVEGALTDWHLVHLGARAVGGAGLIIVEATGVEARGRITPGCSGLWNDAQIEPLSRITNFLRQHGAVPGIQLAHAGRKASAARPWDGGASLSDQDGGWETIGPSAIAFGGRLTRAPREMTIDDIKIVQEAFCQSTKRALKAGFELLELHAAHGYLLHSFYSPLSNKRTDEYGGSFENRIRFTLETAEKMRALWPDHLPFAVRISASDWNADGWTIDDSVDLSKRLKALGVDLIDCSSSNGDRTAKIPFGPGFQVPFAEAVKHKADIATGAVGFITEPAQADEIIRNGRADLVLIAREHLRDPYFAVNAARKLGQSEKDKLPVQYSFYL